MNRKVLIAITISTLLALCGCGSQQYTVDKYTAVKTEFSKHNRLNYREDVFYARKESQPLFENKGVIENKTLDNFIESITKDMPVVDLRSCNYRFEFNTSLGFCYARKGTEEEFKSGKLSEYCDYNETYTVRYYLRDNMVYDYCEYIEPEHGSGLVHSLTISDTDIIDREDSK